MNVYILLQGKMEENPSATISFVTVQQQFTSALLTGKVDAHHMKLKTQILTMKYKILVALITSFSEKCKLARKTATNNNCG